SDQLRQLCSVRPVPDPRRSVGNSAEDQLSVAREPDCIDGTLVFAEETDLFPCFGCPQTGSPVCGTRRDEMLAVINRNRADCTRLPDESLELSVADQVPQHDGPDSGSRCEHRAVLGESERRNRCTKCEQLPVLSDLGNTPLADDARPVSGVCKTTVGRQGN